MRPPRREHPARRPGPRRPWARPHGESGRDAAPASPAAGGPRADPAGACRSRSATRNYLNLGFANDGFCLRERGVVLLRPSRGRGARLCTGRATLGLHTGNATAGKGLGCGEPRFLTRPAPQGQIQPSPLGRASEGRDGGPGRRGFALVEEGAPSANPGARRPASAAAGWRVPGPAPQGCAKGAGGGEGSQRWTRSQPRSPLEGDAWAGTEVRAAGGLRDGRFSPVNPGNALQLQGCLGRVFRVTEDSGSQR